MLAWRRLLILAGLLFALSPAAARAASPFEEAVSAEVAREVGHPVSATCGDFWTWPSGTLLGLFDGRSIRYSPEVCTSARWAFEHPTRAWRLRDCKGYVEGACPDWLPIVRAVVALAHETWHARGIADEATTQCYAVQTANDWATALGFPHAPYFDLTRSIGLDYMAWLYQRELPDFYKSGECRQGGALDLTPRDGLWP